MHQTAFIVRVPNAEKLVGSLRERFDATVGLGVPAHITILAPFMPPEHITWTVLQKIQSTLRVMPSFTFSLTEVGRFPATAYLAPYPASAFVALTEALFRAFPDFPPFRGEHAAIVPHLTVANGDADDAELAALELGTRLQATGPLHGACTEVVLLENSTDRWEEMHVFALGRKDD